MPKSTQEKYATNLWTTSLGTAIYHPIELEENSGKVGDIAFFDENGKYQWVRNTFDSRVGITGCSRFLIGARAWQSGNGTDISFPSKRLLPKENAQTFIWQSEGK